MKINLALSCIYIHSRTALPDLSINEPLVLDCPGHGELFKLTEFDPKQILASILSIVF